MSELTQVTSAALSFLRDKSKSRIYRSDPEAWLHDVIGKRWWSKQQEIANTVVDPTKNHTMTVVKSCNGIGKTAVGADLATWAVAVLDPMETTVLITAPIFSQIKANTFRYIADNYSLARARAELRGERFALPGYIIGDPALKVDRVGGGLPKSVIQAKRPADQNLISSFQGTHDGYVMVILDEAGGLPEDLWIGANAVTTNENVAILAIGNPDDLNTPFHRRFQDRDKYREWTPLSISAFDTPNFTGELIYPDDLVKDREVKSLLVQRDWAEMMERQAHPNVYRSKVLGEFPSDSTHSFFTQDAINKSGDTEIDAPDEAPRVLGVDLAFAGADSTCMYLNTGGKVRLHQKYNGESDYMTQARKCHEEALRVGANVLQVDASGPGEGVFSLLDTQPEFSNRTYVLKGFRGGKASPDNSAWAQARSWSYDMFRRAMQMGELDLDITGDKDLRDQLNSQTFDINNRQAIQITPKKEMRKAGLHSPDNLDAAILAFVPDEVVNPNQLKNGDRISFDPDLFTVEWDLMLSGPGMPL